MADIRIAVHQAFYGEVNRAHSCINQTLSDPDLTSFLIAFTDRPAALPPGVNLLPYLSGSSFSKYYVFTKTFPDATATRAGMVFTHVLILSLKDISLLNNIEDILSHFISSVDNKSDKINEFHISLSELSTELLSKLQPRYVQETISSFISGIKPILFSGDIPTFSTALQQIWNSPDTISREKIKFRISFTLSDIENVEDLTIVSIQKSFLSRWLGQVVVQGENQTIVEISSPSEALFLGHKNKNPFYDFLMALHVNLLEVHNYKQYEKLFNHYTSIKKIDDANLIRQDIRVLSKTSPSSKDGSEIKEKFIDRLSILIQEKKDTNLKALRNIEWTAIPNGESKSRQIVSSFITREIENPNQKQFQNLSELVILAFTDKEQNWWHEAIVESIRNAFKSENESSLTNTWHLIDHSESTLQSLVPILSSIQGCNVILTASMPENLKATTLKSLIHTAQLNHWYLFHAEILHKEFSLEESVEKQLMFEKDLPLSESIGVRHLTAKLSSTRLIELAVQTSEKKLIDLSVEELENSPALLKTIDLSIPSWLTIWTAFVVKTKKVFTGFAGQEDKIINSILNLIINGKDVSDIIIEFMADSPFSDLSNYEDRNKVWGKMNNSYKEKFLIATSKSLFNSLLAGSVELQTIEPEILSKITSDSFVSTFLNENKNNVELVTTAYTIFTALKDNFLADYISYFNGSISERQANKLGELISNREFSRSARAVYDKAKHNLSFNSAYQICRHLVRLNWLESFFDFGLHYHEPATSFTNPSMLSINSYRTQLSTVVILTAIKEEYRAVRLHLKEIVDADNNDTVYEAGIFEFEGKEIAKIIIRECGAKNTNAAQETERAIQYFRPDMILFVGIAGSRKPKDFSVGDVIFPEKVYSYEGGKAERDAFLSRPDNAWMSYSLSERAKKERNKDDWKVLIKGKWNEKVKADLGVIASGEQVIEHYNSEIGRILHDHFNDTSAVEMEGFGFGKAANRQGRETSNILIGLIRGISDILEQPSTTSSSNVIDRRPTYAKELASDTAAAFAYWLIFKTYS